MKFRHQTRYETGGNGGVYKTDKKIKEKQQIGIKVPKFSATAFLGGLFLTRIYIWHCRKSSVTNIINLVGKCGRMGNTMS